MAGIFRKSAIERLSSPDRLDSMLKITSPMSWLGIGAAAILAAAVAVWAFFGTIPTITSAPGFLVYSYNTNTLYSTAVGEVRALLVDVGDEISEGTPILRLKVPSGKTVTVLSDQSGVVSSVLVEKKDVLTQNSELFRLSPLTENEMSVVCYVDLDTAKQLQNGMKASVYLNSVDSGTYGHMEAIVTNVDRYVSSSDAISELLGQDGQMAYVLTQNGPVVAVTCELLADPSAASGYYFTSSSGAGLCLSGGEQVSVQLILDERTPVSMVFPMLGGN